jgi:hypothetical protein
MTSSLIHAFMRSHGLLSTVLCHGVEGTRGGVLARQDIFVLMGYSIKYRVSSSAVVHMFLHVNYSFLSVPKTVDRFSNVQY